MRGTSLQELMRPNGSSVAGKLWTRTLRFLYASPCKRSRDQRKPLWIGAPGEIRTPDLLVRSRAGLFL